MLEMNNPRRSNTRLPRWQTLLRDEASYRLGADAKRFRIQQAACDPWNSIGLRDGCASVGVSLVEVPQQVQHFSGPMKALEAAVKDGRFHHDGNPCHTWQMGNVTVKPDAKDNIFPRKDRPENKIDWPVALIMAMKLALEANPPSVYETRDPLEFNA